MARRTLWVRMSSGTLLIQDLGITVDTTERDLTAEFGYADLADSDDLYSAIGTANLQFSKLGGGSWSTLSDTDVQDILTSFDAEHHDELVGDVTLFGFSLIPISEYFFLNNDFLDVRKIDFSILKEAERGIFFESLKDTKEIIDKAIGLDSSHKKDIEKKNLYEIPQIQQGQ